MFPQAFPHKFQSMCCDYGKKKQNLKEGGKIREGFSAGERATQKNWKAKQQRDSQKKENKPAI